ncbi:HNH endonuclease signature motif containing protein [Microbacterium sp. nov. GSS16]|uniref:HNH endonuclease signature motif containing protein n=1 Tax=Microbacterium sp. nov. GSS16 TaxID=3019890 RepID=UPI00230565C9|nr:HNH endonuclease signature motif containing protein [Microbacterium sp. nov. GSS16]WCD92578.1 DUF222 domain-containing protein [Microbacterium sp. nov. GSS16]
MALFTDIDAQVAALRDLFGDDVTPEDLPVRMSAFGTTELVDTVTAVATLVRGVERIGIVAAGIAAKRSRRDAGQDGLAQELGHRTPAAMLQDITGVSSTEAQRQVRLGLSVLEADPSQPGGDAERDSSTQSRDLTDVSTTETPRLPWHAPLSAALLRGALSPAQHDAIQRGLGHPVDEEHDTHAAWSAAAEQLIADATARTVEELRIQSRAIRDQLDPDGAERRFAERYERRAFRLWTDADGVERGRIDFEDDGAAWVRAIRDAALRPRRGGPRFIDSAEVRRGQDLVDDPRTNDQLSYDLLFDLLRAGALADATAVFGTRQAAVRVVRVIDSAGQPISARTEDFNHSLPQSAVDHRICESGTVPVDVDPTGDPLNVGREHRLFTPKQRIALAIRDGGCRWRGCDRAASYGEAHHIDEWHRDGGRTDIDRGILLCRHHHMQLHHGGWRITRDGRDDFLLHPPGRRPAVPLPPRAALTAAWAGIDPPPKRFRPAA